MRPSLFALLIIVIVIIAACVRQTAHAQTKPAPERPSTLPRFADISRAAGLTVSHLSSPEEKYIIESVSGGVGFIDCDNDGKLDIITVNGSSVDRYRNGGDPMITLYHQEPGLKFKDITAEAGLNRKGWGMGVAVADFINVLYLGQMVASVPAADTNNDDVVGYITGSKTYAGASA